MGAAVSLFFSANDPAKQTLYRRITLSDEQFQEQQDRSVCQRSFSLFLAICFNPRSLGEPEDPLIAVRLERFSFK
jgi:hypothetical protein